MLLARVVANGKTLAARDRSRSRPSWGPGGAVGRVRALTRRRARAGALIPADRFARPSGSVLHMIGRIVIEDIRPQVDCGQFTSRAVAGETIPVEATIFRDGHNEVVAAAVRLTGPGDRRGQLVPLPEGNHRPPPWQGGETPTPPPP